MEVTGRKGSEKGDSLLTVQRPVRGPPGDVVFEHCA